MNDNKSPLVCPACGLTTTFKTNVMTLPSNECSVCACRWNETQVRFLRSRIIELEEKCEAMSAALRQIYGIAAEY